MALKARLLKGLYLLLQLIDLVFQTFQFLLPGYGGGLRHRPLRRATHAATTAAHATATAATHTAATAAAHATTTAAHAAAHAAADVNTTATVDSDAAISHTMVIRHIGRTGGLQISPFVPLKGFSDGSILPHKNRYFPRR